MSGGEFKAFSNVGIITGHRLQENGDGRVRVLVPCFFGLCWKTAKVWHADRRRRNSFASKSNACGAIATHNERLTAAADARARSAGWRDVGRCDEDWPLP